MCLLLLLLQSAMGGPFLGGAAAPLWAGFVACCWVLVVAVRAVLAEQTWAAQNRAPLRFFRISSFTLGVALLLLAWGVQWLNAKGLPLLLTCRVENLANQVCVVPSRAVPALACALAAVLVWLQLLRLHLRSLKVLPLEAPLLHPSWTLAVPPLFREPALISVAACLLAHYVVPLHLLVHVADAEAQGSSFVVCLRATLLFTFAAYGVALATRAVLGSPLPAMPAGPVLLQALTPPSSPLVALPLLRGLHLAVHTSPEGLYAGLLCSRVPSTGRVFWASLLEHAKSLLAEKEAMARLWAKGVAPLPVSASAGRVLELTVKPDDPVTGLEDLPQLLLWMRTVTRLVEQSLHHDTTGVLTSHRSVETWLESVCGLYHGLQVHAL